jgi:hypothetical protein
MIQIAVGVEKFLKSDMANGEITYGESKEG